MFSYIKKFFQYFSSSKEIVNFEEIKKEKIILIVEDGEFVRLSPNHSSTGRKWIVFNFNGILYTFGGAEKLKNLCKLYYENKDKDGNIYFSAKLTIVDNTIIKVESLR
jgi:hypothetical protein